MKQLRTRLNRLHPDHKRIAQGAMRVAFFLLIGKMAGAIKEIAVAHRYGVSDIVDAYQFTLTMANWLPVTMVGAFSIVLIPALVKVRYAGQPDRARFIRELQGWIVVLGVLLSVVTYYFWPQVLQYMGGNLSSQTRQASTELINAFAPAVLLTLIIGLCTARLRAHERHINNLLDSIPALMILLAILITPGNTSVYPLLWGTLLGYLVQAVWLSALARKADGGNGGWPRPGLQSAQWPMLLSAAGIMLVGQIAMSFVGPLDQMTAARLGDNANATLGYATRLLSLVIGIGAASVGRAALPVLADVQSRGNPAQARSMALKWSALMLLVGIVAVMVGWLLAPWMVKLLFENGAFTPEDTQKVASVLRWGLLQLPFYFGVLILVQLMASQNRYKLMAIIAIANFALKAGMNLILAPVMGAEGIMLATSLMYLLSYLCYFFAVLKYGVATKTSST
ncbi:polysaccharide biosynthesis C-terminal domain-containing protein [Advenella sp. WQ 585]|uniref:Polysaccharide biosynthesis C-terminal domain-containing protein n=1 Tax=Advenella mandrilli TaxID=2800330 RepID=A0ABS1ECN5_9BURK|nr:lipid II flippase MurJ [Advenella mandrilli]MBK1781657.1 polysaccharide biosynthesis C-terminal domain-containing protein [Advenella mandrilli]